MTNIHISVMEYYSAERSRFIFTDVKISEDKYISEKSFQNNLSPKRTYGTIYCFYMYVCVCVCICVCVCVCVCEIRDCKEKNLTFRRRMHFSFLRGCCERNSQVLAYCCVVCLFYKYVKSVHVLAV